jgi:hypothetical protein
MSSPLQLDSTYFILVVVVVVLVIFLSFFIDVTQLLAVLLVLVSHNLCVVPPLGLKRPLRGLCVRQELVDRGVFSDGDGGVLRTKVGRVTVADAGKFFVLMGHTKLRGNDRETWVGSESQEGGADVSGPSEGNK